MLKVTYFIDKRLKSKTVVVAENKGDRISTLVGSYFAEGVHKDKNILAKKFDPDYEVPTNKNIKDKNKKEKMNENKKKVTYNVEDRLVSDIELIAKLKGRNKNEIVENYINEGIEKDKKYLISHLTRKELGALCKN